MFPADRTNERNKADCLLAKIGLVGRLRDNDIPSNNETINSVHSVTEDTSTNVQTFLKFSQGDFTNFIAFFPLFQMFNRHGPK